LPRSILKSSETAAFRIEGSYWSILTRGLEPKLQPESGETWA